jgi:hypothetical protein
MAEADTYDFDLATLGSYMLDIFDECSNPGVFNLVVC